MAFLATLDQSHGHALKMRDHAAIGGLPHQGTAVADLDLGDELFAVAGNLTGHGLALWQQPGQEPNDIGQADHSQQDAQTSKIEKPYRRLPHAHGRAGHQQVGGGANQGHHAAQDGGEAQWHHQPRRALVQAFGNGRHDGNKDHHDWRVVDKGAERGNRGQGQAQGQGGAALKAPGHDADAFVQGAGTDQTLSHHHQGQDGDQGGIGEAGQQGAGIQHPACFADCFPDCIIARHLKRCKMEQQ